MAMEFGKLNFAVGFNRTSAFPLDANGYFESYDAAVKAVASAAEVGSSDSAYYFGQQIAVVENGVATLYIIEKVTVDVSVDARGYKGQLKEVGSKTLGDEASIELSSEGVLSIYGFADAGNKCVPYKDTATGKLVWGTVEGLIPDAVVPVGDNETVLVSVDGTDTTKRVISLLGKEAAADKAVLRKHVSAEGVVSYSWDVIYSKVEVDTLLSGKVDAVEGKGLSTNDYDAAAVAEVAKIKDKADASTVTELAGKVTKNTKDIAKINTDLEGLTGAMHFIGTSTTDPAGESGATVEGHETFKAGDVCLFGDKEYVYNDVTSKWVELGDEGSHATKGYVDTAKQAAIDAANAATDTKLEAYSNTTEVKGLIATAKGEAVTEAGTAADGKIAEALKAYTTTEALNTKLGKKVDAVTGKSLVADELITKMEGIQDNAAIKGVEGGIKLDAETGKISIDAENVPVIAQDKVDGLADALAAKKDEAGVNALIAAATIKAEKIDGVVAEAAKVSNALTAGEKVFDGSKAIEITAADLGALTAIEKATDSVLGGIMTGYESTEENRAVQLDETGKAYVNVPKAAEALVKSVSAEFEVSAEGQLGVKSVNVNKLAQTDGEKLVLDGGNAAD